MKLNYKWLAISTFILLTIVLIALSDLTGTVLHRGEGGNIRIENDNYLIDWELESKGYSPHTDTYNLKGHVMSKLQDKTIDFVLISPIQVEPGSKAHVTRNITTSYEAQQSYFCNSPLFGWFNQSKYQVYCNYTQETDLINPHLENKSEIINATNEYWFVINPGKNATLYWNQTYFFTEISTIDITSMFSYYYIDTLKSTYPSFNWTAVEGYGSHFYVIKDATFKQGTDYEVSLEISVNKTLLPIKYSLAFIDRANDQYLLLDPVMADAFTWDVQSDFENGTWRENISTGESNTIRLGHYSNITGTMMACWPFEEGPGGVVVDYKGVHSSNTTDYRITNRTATGKIGYAVDLENSTFDYIGIPDHVDWDRPANDEFTVSHWVNPEDSDADGKAQYYIPLVNRFHFNYAWNMEWGTQILLWNYSCEASVTGNARISTTAPYNAQPGVWTMVTCAYNGSRMFLYINDTLVNPAGTAVSSIPSYNRDMAMGVMSGAVNLNYATFDGMFDEVRYYNRFLNATEVNTLYNNYQGRPCNTSDTRQLWGIYSDRQNWTPQSTKTFKNITISIQNATSGGVYFRYNISNSSLDTSEWYRLPFNGTNLITLETGADQSIFYQFLINSSVDTMTPVLTSYTLTQDAPIPTTPIPQINLESWGNTTILQNTTSRISANVTMFNGTINSVIFTVQFPNSSRLNYTTAQNLLPTGFFLDEDADVYGQTGVWNTTFNSSYVHDNNYTTYGNVSSGNTTADIYLNWTRPANTNGSSFFQITLQGRAYNLSLIGSGYNCFNLSNGLVQMVYRSTKGGYPQTNIFCGYKFTVGAIQYISLLNDGNGTHIYEDAMYWYNTTLSGDTNSWYYDFNETAIAGTYNLTQVWANDSTGVSNFSLPNSLLTVNQTLFMPTNVQLLVPLNDTYSNKTSMWINTSATDENGDTLYYAIYADQNTNPTTLRQNTTTTYYNYTSLSDGRYYTKVIVGDGTETNTSSVVTFLIDSTNPQISYVNPSYANMTSIKTQIIVNYSVIDTNANMSSLSTRKGSQDYFCHWEIVFAGVSAQTNPINLYCDVNYKTYSSNYMYLVYNITDFIEGETRYQTYGETYDNAGNTNLTETRSYYYDIRVPNLSIQNPIGINYNNGSNISIQYTANDTRWEYFFNVTSGLDYAQTNTTSAYISSTWFNLNNGTNYTLSNGAGAFNTTKGSYVLYLFTNDTAGNVKTAQVSFNVSNIIPIITAINITSNDGANKTDANLTVAWNFTDNDGDTQITYEILWFNSSYQMTSARNSTILYSNATVKGQVYKASVRVNDGTDWSVWYNTSGLTILNTIPSLSNYIINSTTGTNTTTDNITAWFTPSDSDGDTIYNTTFFKSGSKTPLMVMDFNANTSTAIDHSGYNNNGTLIGATWTSSGISGGAYRFDGINDFINLSNPTSLDLDSGEPFTITLHTKVLSSQHGGIFGRWTGSNNKYLLYYQAGGDNYFRWIFNNGTTNLDNVFVTNPTIDTYYFLTIAYDGTKFLLYSNGVNILNVTGDITTTDAEWNLGRYGSTFYNGTIDEVRVYNYTLTGTEIISLYQQTNKLHSDATVKGETWTASTVVSDGADYSVVSSSQITILNAVPTISIINISSNDGANQTNANLTAGWAMSDVDSDSQASYEVLWFNTSYQLTSAVNSTVLYSNETVKGQVYKASVRVNDGTDWSAWYNTSGLTILNDAPILTKADIFSLDGTNNSNSNLTGTWIGFADVDNDISITNETRWYKDNIEMTSLKNVTLVYSNYTTTGELWKFSTRTSDGTDWSAWVNSTTMNIEISNMVPVLNSVNISSSTANTTLGNLLVGYNFTDTDLDTWAIETRWYKNNAEQATLKNTTLVYSGNLSETDTWKAGVRIHDGVSSSDWANSSNLTIYQDNPSLILVTLSDTEVQVGTFAVVSFFLNDSSNSYSNCSASYTDPATHIHSAFNNTITSGVNTVQLNFESFGGFNVSLSCGDIFYYSNLTSLTIISVENAPSAGSGSSSGNGQNPLTVPNVNTGGDGRFTLVDMLKIKDTYSFNSLPSNTKIEFYINQNPHDLTVLGVTKDSATFKLASDNPIIFDLQKNTTDYFDITQDNTPDVSVTLHDIQNESNIDLTLTIYDKIAINKFNEWMTKNKKILVISLLGIITVLLFRKRKR